MNNLLNENMALYPGFTDDVQRSVSLLQSYSDFPSYIPVDPHRLASSGFCYTGCGDTDKVTCISCHKSHENWKPGEDGMLEQLHTQNCTFVKSSAVQSRAPAAGHVLMEEYPFEEGYHNFHYRVKSFQHLERLWKSAYRHQTSIEEFAEAGFYYQGKGDKVQCFSCKGSLSSWEANDDVWVEHAKWFPKCSYVQQRRGSRFIQTLQKCDETPFPPKTDL